MGIYGVSYIVVLRTREVGIRMAIGAQAGDVRWAILRECARPLVVGLASGRLLVALTLLAIGLMASYPPARRATRVDPLVALRHQ